MSACSSPTQPTPPPTGAPPAIVCPVGLSAQSADGNPILVTYPDPVVSGGQLPLTVGCGPVSGASYPVGTTSVNCSVTDALRRTSSCTFAVTVIVVPRPRLSVTNFLAFGDSITAGEIPDDVDTPAFVIRPQAVHMELAYPLDLQALLQQRYASQTISVFNDGVQGETTGYGLARLPAEIALHHPDVLLLLEGVNDLDEGFDGQTALDNLRSMIRIARARNARVMVGTLLPQNPSGCSRCRVTAASAALIVPFNNLLKPMALAEGALVVDTYSGLLPDLADWLSPLDGLHPTAAGYQQMAQLFFKQIIASFELPPAVLSPARRDSFATPAAAGRGSPAAAPATRAVPGSAAPSRGRSR